MRAITLVANSDKPETEDAPLQRSLLQMSHDSSVMWLAVVDWLHFPSELSISSGVITEHDLITIRCPCAETFIDHVIFNDKNQPDFFNQRF